MQNSLRNYADTRSRSQFKVTGLSLEFRVRSVSQIPVEEFSLNFGQMFTLVRRCAESITQPCRLIIKVTVQGEMMCRTHSSTMQTHKVTVQGHRFEP